MGSVSLAEFYSALKLEWEFSFETHNFIEQILKIINTVTSKIKKEDKNSSQLIKSKRKRTIKLEGGLDFKGKGRRKQDKHKNFSFFFFASKKEIK